MSDRIDRTSQTSVRDFLNVIFRRRWMIAGIVVLATFLVFFINARRPNLYESSSKILLMRGEQTGVLSSSVRYLGWAEEVSSQIEVILSEAVFQRAARMFADSVRVHGYPEHWKFMPGAVRADVVGESNAFVIRYVDLNPAVCQLGCDAVTLAFRDYYRERKAPPELRDFFHGEIAQVREELDMWRDRRQKFLDDASFWGADETSRFLLQKIGLLEHRLSEMDGEISSQEIRVSNLEKLRHKTGAELEQELAFSGKQLPLQSQIVQSIKSSLQNLTLRREELMNMYTEKHPEVIAVNEQIAGLRRDLERQVENAYRVDSESLDGMRARKENIVAELADARKQLEQIPQNERQVNEIDDMIARLEKRHELLLQRQSESEIALASRPDWEVTILSSASPPTNKKTNDYVRLALGPFLALIVALGIAFFLESADHSIRGSADAEEFLEVPVLATISDFHSSNGRRKRAPGPRVASG